MSLIKCPECGKEVSTQAPNCPSCGHPLTPSPLNVQTTIVKHKGFWSIGRLTIGVISIVLFIIVSFQSCAVGLGNSLQDNGAASGSIGFFLAILLLLSGIIGICTRNSTSKVGPILACIFYMLGAVMAIGQGDTYPDLPIWGVISAIFGVVFLISAIKTKKQ